MVFDCGGGRLAGLRNAGRAIFCCDTCGMTTINCPVGDIFDCHCTKLGPAGKGILICGGRKRGISGMDSVSSVICSKAHAPGCATSLGGFFSCHSFSFSFVFMCCNKRILHSIMTKCVNNTPDTGLAHGTLGR